jgi:hypothetical protein
MDMIPTTIKSMLLVALLVAWASACASHSEILPPVASMSCPPPAVVIAPAAGTHAPLALDRLWLESPATNSALSRPPSLPLAGNSKLTEAAYRSMQEPRPEHSTVNVGASASVETQLSEHFLLRRSGAYWQPVRVP